MTGFRFPLPWLGKVDRPAAGHRLVCLPFPGAGASTFLPWAKLLPVEVELAAVQLPGREDRFPETPLTSWSDLVGPIAAAILDCPGPPVALFGHSGGALLAFEVARELRARGTAPAHLFVSAEPAPDHPRDSQLHTLADAEFLRQVRARGGIPAELADNQELLELLLPVLRADFTWSETYRYQSEPPLSCPLTAFAGRQDQITGADELAGWRAQTTGPFRTQLVDGGHFYLREPAGAETVTDQIARALRPG